jgi:nucleoside-diphosphate-sugar epimerase
MRLLLLGGPKFLGRALIEAALAQGHEMTTFNREPPDEDSSTASRGGLPDDRLLDDYSNYGALKALSEESFSTSSGLARSSSGPG